GLHHHRRSPARLWRRLFPAHPRQQEPPCGARSGGAVRSRHDGGGAAQRGHARRHGGRADRRAFADHERRRRAAEFIPARFRPGVTLHPYSISSGSKEILKKSRQRLSVIVARYLFDPAPHFASITTPFLFLMVLES